MENVRRKYNSLSLENKLKAIKRVENGEKMKDVAVSFKIKPNTLSTICKQKEKLKTKLNENPACKKFKRMRDGKNANLDKAVVTFIQQARQHNIPVSGVLIQTKAKQLGELLNINDFTASAGWLQRLKKRTGMKWRCLTGDAAEADQQIAHDWIENVFVPLMAQYDENDVFNADEAGLFFKCLPGKTMAFKDDKCLNGKNSKERITIMVCSNMTGTEKVKPFVIGKSKRPRCFKNVKSLPVDYDSNKKAWMNSFLFERWMVNLDEKFTTENRKVLFFVDNCSAHDQNIKTKLKSIRLEFFPPNLTSILQPMDKGIIRTIKVHYRNTIVLKLIDRIEKNLPVEKLTVLDAINILSNIWDNKVTPTIIRNCFRKAGFVDSHFDEEDDVPLSSFHDEARNFEQLKSVLPDINISFDEYVTFDEDIMVGAMMTDEDIIERIQDENLKMDAVDVNVSNIDTSNSPENISRQRKISCFEAKETLQTLRLALEQAEQVPQLFFQHLNVIEEFLNKK